MEPPAAVRADGSPATGIVRGTPGRDPRDGRVEAVRHPQRAARERQRDGPVAHAHAREHPSRRRVELQDRGAVVAGDPQRARPERERGRADGERDRPPRARCRVERVQRLRRGSRRPTAARRRTPAPLRWRRRDGIVCVTVSLAGSIRLTVAPTAPATQIEPAPLTMLAGSPPTGMRSTTAPPAGSMRRTAPSPALAAHNEPAPVASAVGAPGERGRGGDPPRAGVERDDAAGSARQCRVGAGPQRERGGHGGCGERRDRGEREPAARAARAEPGPARRERRVVLEDPPLQLVQLRAGLEPQLVDEPPAERAEGVERVRLAPGAIERQHQRGDQALVPRMRGHQRFQLRDELRPAAGRELRLHPRLERAQPQLLQPLRLGAAERQVEQVGPRRAAPQRERLRGMLAGQRLELGHVELARLHAQGVAPRGPGQPVVAEQLAQPVDVRVERLRGARRQPLRPQRLEQLAAGHDAVRVQQQQRQQRPLLATPQRQRTVVRGHLERPEHGKPHGTIKPVRERRCEVFARCESDDRGMTRTLLIALLAALAPATPAAASVGVIPVAPQPSAVTIDPATHTAYVASGLNLNGGDFNGNTVTVVDTRRCNAHGVAHCPGPWPTITVGHEPGSIAVDATTGTVYVTSAGDGTVAVIDGTRCNAEDSSGCGKPAATVPAGAGPLGIVSDAANHTVYVSNFFDGTVSMLDSATCNGTHPGGCPAGALPTVAVGGNPVDVDVNPRTHTVYVGNLTGLSAFDDRTCNATRQSGCAAVGQAPIPQCDSEHFGWCGPFSSQGRRDHQHDLRVGRDDRRVRVRRARVQRREPGHLRDRGAGSVHAVPAARHRGEHRGGRGRRPAHRLRHLPEGRRAAGHRRRPLQRQPPRRLRGAGAAGDPHRRGPRGGRPRPRHPDALHRRSGRQHRLGDRRHALLGARDERLPPARAVGRAPRRRLRRRGGRGCRHRLRPQLRRPQPDRQPALHRLEPGRLRHPADRAAGEAPDRGRRRPRDPHRLRGRR